MTQAAAGSPGTPSVPPAIHATTVAHAGRAALIQGASGSGKSALALQLIALGATLVADDRTVLHCRADRIIAEAPASLLGRIEARGVGILAAPVSSPVPLALVIDMDTEETDRLPPRRKSEILGLGLPLLRKVNAPHFPAAIMAYLEHGRIA